MRRVNSLKINKNIYEGIAAFAFPGGLLRIVLLFWSDT